MPSDCSRAPSGPVGSEGPGRSLTQYGVSSRDPQLSPFTPCTRGLAPRRASRGLGAVGGGPWGDGDEGPSRPGLPSEVLVSVPSGLSTDFQSWAARSWDPVVAAASRAASSCRRGVVLGKALQRRVPAQPLAHGPRHPQHGQLGAQHQQVSVVSQRAPVGGSSLSALP